MLGLLYLWVEVFRSFLPPHPPPHKADYQAFVKRVGNNTSIGEGKHSIDEGRIEYNRIE